MDDTPDNRSNNRIDANPQSSRSVRAASVIVWDPSPISLLALAGVVDGCGHRVICAREASAAIASLPMGPHDLMICHVGDDAAEALETVQTIRESDGYDQFPVIMIADPKWAGLEKKCEAARVATRCLFEPIDPNSLIAVIDHLLWMPSLISSHRRRGSRPNRPGWVSLDNV